MIKLRSRIPSLLAIGLTALIFADEASAQIQQVSGRLRSNQRSTVPIRVAEGQVLEFVDFFVSTPKIGAAAGATLDCWIQQQISEEKYAKARRWDSGISSQRTTKVVGPVDVEIQTDVGADVDYTFQYRLYDNVAGSTAGLSTQACNSVVIPSDVDGDTEIILESSRDLVTWTRAELGVYNKDVVNRFFRLRAVRTAPEGE